MVRLFRLRVRPCTSRAQGKEKGVAISRNSLIFRALQDGLGFKKMKPTEIFRNYKKLKYRKLRVPYEKFSKVKISPNLKNGVQIGCNFQKKCVSLHPVKRI